MQPNMSSQKNTNRQLLKVLPILPCHKNHDVVVHLLQILVVEVLDLSCFLLEGHLHPVHICCFIKIKGHKI